MLKTILKPFASLTLTVILLAFSMVLIYAGTCAQVHMDIWRVQHEYFHNMIAWVGLEYFIPNFGGHAPRNWPQIPIPGGYLLGPLLLINLLAAHAVRFKFSIKDLWLIPQMAVIGYALYTWQMTGGATPMLIAIALGVLFLVTLFLVHSKRAGVIVIHLGLVLLLIGEGITSGAAKETRMEITEGSYATYSSDIREPELAVVDKSAAETDRHVVVPKSMLKTGATFNDPLPFRVTVDEYLANSRPVNASADPSKPSIQDDATQPWTVKDAKGVTGVQGGAVDLPSAFVTVAGKDGRPIGKYLLTVMTRKPQVIDVGGKQYELSLRFQRDYKPFKIHLTDFKFDRYTGTNVAKNFSSDVVLDDPANHEHREVHISMNNPLRYRGETYFQADWDKETEQKTILQVVRNPAATLPYVAILIAGIGLVIHFGVTLINFLSKRTATGQQLALGFVLLMVLVVMGWAFYVTLGIWGVLTVATVLGGGVGFFLSQKAQVAAKAAVPGARVAPGAAAGRKGAKVVADEGRYELAPENRLSSPRFLVPAGILGLLLLYVVGHAMPRPLSPEYDLDVFAKIPVSYEGRVQPFDSIARNALKVLRGRESALKVEQKDGKEVETKVQPVPWLLDTWTNRAGAADYKVFVIDHPEVKAFLGLNEKQKYFSKAELAPLEEKIDRSWEELNPIREDKSKGTLSAYQNALLEVGDRWHLYRGVATFVAYHVVPPGDGRADWSRMIDVAREGQASGVRDKYVDAYFNALQAYADKDPAKFNGDVARYARLMESRQPADSDRTAFEAWFNRFDPFTLSMVMYVLVFLLAAFSWTGLAARPLARSALWVLGLAMVIHTFGLASRIYMSGRPPVTNLASSAIFIGWGMVIFAICLELIYKNGIGSVIGAVAGFPTLMIASRLSLDGDTMKVLQAVLDTNIWLATHVVSITMGYAATFLAGLIGITYVILGVFTPYVNTDLKKTLGRMMYGITCFALLFSFVGTILGGIWADQSWGRFWGWDPKENGAVLIVLANAIFLHARWGGLVKERGMANIAIFGNIVTAWSYFGTNMLGVGLHAYGFMAAAVFWLLLFVAGMVFFILCGLLPTNSWRSFQDEGKDDHRTKGPPSGVA